MHKHFLQKKITGLLALSLLFTSVPAWAAEDTNTAAPAEASTPAYYELNFDAKNFTKETLFLHGQPVEFRIYEGCHYTAYPVAADKEQLTIYIPEAYFQKMELNGYTAKTAPIFMPLTADETEYAHALPEGTDKENRQASLSLLALAHGYVVALPGPQALTPPAQERLGKAPQAIISYKAAIRYLRRNQNSLPAGDTNRIVVSGCGTSGSLALQLAASANQPLYQPLLYSIGAATRPDNIFAAQVYEPVTGLHKDVTRFGWTLPDGRPDPNAASVYAPMLDTKASLHPETSAPVQTGDTEAVIEEAATDMPPKAAGEVKKTADEAKKEVTTDKAKASAAALPQKAAPIIYDTPEHRDYLAKKATYEQVEEETNQLIKEYTPKSQAAPYLRLSATSSANQELQELKEAFEDSDTSVTSLEGQPSPLEDAQAFFAWIDEADAERDEYDKFIAELWKKQSAKLARAKLLADRAALKAQKKQAQLEKEASQAK